MNTQAQVIRAVGAVFLQRTIKKYSLIGLVILVILYTGVTLLAFQLSQWFLLLLTILIPLTLIGLVALIIIGFIAKKVMPRPLKKSERKQIIAVSDKISGIIETARTPYPIALFLIAKDVLRRRESEFLYRLTNDSKTINRDIQNLTKLFG